ncbi:CBS domain-containing protein [Actinomadura hibisca]|uniref:CBS domain-containing protein n=1 Tax=Actinomadura hibisca TaxID=68565 RepID=UPI000836AA1D|nr:CBS domain-containing protein [Actinomadura hibisca]
MTTAQELMNSGVHCVSEGTDLRQAAQIMRDQQIGSLPICDEGGALRGIITDRDIVIGCVAAGGDPRRTTAGELASREPHTVQASSDVSEVLETMQRHQIRRLPVLEEDRVVGMISEADLARHLPEDRLAAFVESVYAER